MRVYIITLFHTKNRACSTLSRTVEIISCYLTPVTGKKMTPLMFLCALFLHYKAPELQSSVLTIRVQSCTGIVHSK